MTPLLASIAKLLLDQLKKIALSDQPDVGQWRGRYEVLDFGTHDKKKVFEFRNDPTDPLRFHHFASGFQFMPRCRFITDLGSIPWIFQGMSRKYGRLKPDDFREAYIGHDSCCENGWIWVRRGEQGTWHRMAVTPVQSDVLMFWFLSAPTLAIHGQESKSATRLECQGVYRAVRIFHAAK
jgi:hypothetical protein